MIRGRSLNNSDDTFDYIINIGKITLAITIIENLYFIPAPQARKR